MEEAKEECQFRRLSEAQKTIQKTTVQYRIQIIKLLDNSRQLSETLSYLKLPPLTYKERFDRARSQLNFVMLENIQKIMLY
ncbi:MAG: hypothetical protein ACW98F_20495, partial [Candidatus Hodarchaeales archaeon]